MRNLKLILAYDGTKYHGFQIQKGTGLPTIQGTLQKVLSSLAGEEIIIIGSGRTDAGVHAKGQVINFYSNINIPVDRVPLALNALLPADLVVLKAEDVPLDFHASFSARYKTYDYLFYNARIRDPFSLNYTYHVPVPLDIRAMQEACLLFKGEHDFRGFCSSHTTKETFRRTIYFCEIEKMDKIIKFSITGDGFLYNMVRIMGGTLLEIGKGKRKAEELASLLRTGQRTLSGVTLPPQGLCLSSVEYD